MWLESLGILSDYKTTYLGMSYYFTSFIYSIRFNKFVAVLFMNPEELMPEQGKKEI